MMEQQQQPVLVYDGDCSICQYWIDYWRRLTGDKVRYRPYQEAATDYDIPESEFKRAIQFIDSDGVVSSGAGATFRLLQEHMPYKILLFLYRFLPGFAFIAEVAYGFFSRHRGLLRFISHLFWGKHPEPPDYTLTRWLFLRFLALIYFGAFVSLGTQIKGLVGEDGIIPIGFFLQNAAGHFGDTAWLNLPTLFWLQSDDLALLLVCLAGMLFSVLLLINRLALVSLIALYVLYLSLVVAGQHFMQFQWDLLLLEVGFLAIFLQTRSGIVVWLYRWLVFRYMLISGVVKITSRDPTWDNLTALFYHFETQPLPVPLAWYAHHLPDTLLMMMTGATLVIELLVPFLLFLPRRFRCIAGVLFITFQTAIILTGNYNFFNLLTIAICLFLFDDAALRWLLPGRTRSRVLQSAVPVHARNTVIAACIAVLILSISSAQLYRIFTRSDNVVVQEMARALHSLNIVNVYGPFAVMTTVRHEIDIQGSNDRIDWQSYDFKYKPDALDAIPGWIIPHQPRLDWQMWFAALNKAGDNPWFRNLMYRLLQGRQDVLDLFASVPFRDKPPEYLRAVLYEYRFTTPDARATSGNWWTREETKIYFPVARLSPEAP